LFTAVLCMLSRDSEPQVTGRQVTASSVYYHNNVAQQSRRSSRGCRHRSLSFRFSIHWLRRAASKLNFGPQASLACAMVAECCMRGARIAVGAKQKHAASIKAHRPRRAMRPRGAVLICAALEHGQIRYRNTSIIAYIVKLSISC
jgi:hypothetical protein